MQAKHLPIVNARYWAGILMASIAGTNLGDLYAHDSGLGIGLGLVLLAALVAIAFVIEQRDQLAHEAWYWFAILVIRTGATNIADTTAMGAHIPIPMAIRFPIVLLGSGVLIAFFAWRARRARGSGFTGLPDANGNYWAAMLAAGVFGTIAGDLTSFLLGHFGASLALAALLLVVLALGRGKAASRVGIYWLTIAVARTAGTAIGDLLAEDKAIGLGLLQSTTITTIVFAVLLLAWSRGTVREPLVA